MMHGQKNIKTYLSFSFPQKSLFTKGCCAANINLHQDCTNSYNNSVSKWMQRAMKDWVLIPPKAQTFLLATLSRHALVPMHLLNWY